jgi:hypothetical protein
MDIFFDTEVFISINFNFSNRKLLQIIDFARKGELTLYITDVVYRETIIQIKKQVEIAFRSFSKIKDDYRILNNNDVFFAAHKPERMQEYIDTITKNFTSFVKEHIKKVLPVNYVDMSKSFDAYFGMKPPFNKELKKNEFPDAINISVIEAWAKEKRKRVTIISNDTDIKDLVETFGITSRVMVIETIEKLINNLVSTKELEGKIAKLINDNRSNFQRVLKESFDDAKFEIRDFFAEVNEKKIVEWNITNISIIEVRDDYVLTECEFEITYEYTVKYGDPDSYYWDSETKHAEPMGYKHNTREELDYFYFPVELEKVDESDWEVSLTTGHISHTVKFEE